MNRLFSKIPSLLLASILGLIASSSAFGQATIVIENADAAGVGFNDTAPATPVGGNSGTTVGAQRLIVFQAAANVWGATLTSGPTIRIHASWAPLTCTATSGVLGSAGTTSVSGNFANAPFMNTWYNAALANALSGSDLDSANAEINAKFNLSVGTSGCLESGHWYYGLDNNHGPSGLDLFTVLLHEFAHGLGFASFTDETTGKQIQDLPCIYDRFLLDNTTGKTWPQMTDAERVSSAINTGNLVWNGTQVTTDSPIVLTGGKDSLGHPLMFAPSPVDPGSSVSHWDKLATPNQLMEPNLNGSLTHNVTPPSDLTFSLLKDIGWCTSCPPPPPPPNDNFANAQTLSGCSGSVTGANFAATKEAGEPNNPDSPLSTKSVWYQWQAPSTGSVTIDTIGSDFDTVLAVYTGNTLGALNLVANNDDNEDPNTPQHEVTSLVTFTATQGTTYRIAVNGFNNAGSGGDTGDIKLNWTENCTQAPTILTEEGATNKAVALDSVTFVRGPFSVIGPHNFSADQHTRVILFTSNLGLTLPDPSILTVQAGGTSLTVENVGTVSGVAGLDASYIVVRLPTGLATGDLPLIVTFHGVASSNTPTLGISP